MEEHIPANLLPTLYRRVLDAATRLEAAGSRQDAVRIRRHAVAVYASRWDRWGAQALEGLEVDALSLLAERPSARARMLERLTS